MNLLKPYLIALAGLFYVNIICAQKVSGKFSLLANQEIRLEAFQGMTSYLIDQTVTDASGNFSLNYSKVDFGMGYLISADDKPLLVVLNGEDIIIHGEAPSYLETVRVIQGKENQIFEQYAKLRNKREQALNAWIYLEKMYKNDSLFRKQSVPLKAIQNEIKRIKDEDRIFLDKIDKKSYVGWFLPMRKLVNSVYSIAQYRTEEIPETIAAFRKIDYTDNRLYRSGLLTGVIDSHFWLIENSGRSQESVFIEMKLSIDIMLANLAKDENRLNEVTKYLFHLFEKQSLYEASEHLALKILNEVSCTIDGDLAKQLETYRAMKKGNIAPDIVFPETTYYPEHTNAKKLSDIKTKYTLVVFGAGWCTRCQQEVPKIASLYEKWLKHGVEVVLVSLDETPIEFAQFAARFPFISTTDFQKWDSKMVKDYYVFGTPSMFLLDEDRKIILRPSSVQQVDAWVERFLIGQR
jgi:thiol-disulfide isomerase/thioredoxin